MRVSVFKKTKDGLKNLLEIYVGVPSLAKKLLPMVIVEHITASFCLNISAYFKRIDSFNYEIIGQLISVYYWGCLIGALIGGFLTLRYKSTRISSVGLLILSMCFLSLFFTTNEGLIAISMFLLGAVGTCVGTSNLTSLVRTAKNIEGSKLQIISLELILFNVVYSFTAFVLLDLSPADIVFFIKWLAFFMMAVGLFSLFNYKDVVFSPPVIKKGEAFVKVLLPAKAKEFALLMFMVFLFGLIFSMIKVIFTPTIIDRFGDNLISVTVASINPWAMLLFQPLIVSKIKSSNSAWFLGAGGLIVGVSYNQKLCMHDYAATV